MRTLPTSTALRNAFFGVFSLLSVVAMTAPAAAEPAYGFAVGDTLPIYVFHGEDGVRRSTTEFRGKWFLFKRGAEWTPRKTVALPAFW
ncbi:hypothetical protein [Azospirillum formosense]|uniref:hypothetical protein n=1 Tax=Azospirillum formosense TaxID=861533 RepID=UPI00338DB87A